MFKRILIPTDGSPVANKAAKAGIALARRLGAKVTAYCAIEQLQPIYSDDYVFNQKEIDGFEERAGEAGQKRVDAIDKMAKAASEAFASMVTKTNTAYEAIIDAERKRKCEAIFIASHTRRGFPKLIMGSVTQMVLPSKILVLGYR